MQTCRSSFRTLRLLAVAGAVGALASMASAQQSTTNTQPSKGPKVVPSTSPIVGKPGPSATSDVGPAAAKKQVPLSTDPALPGGGGFHPRFVPGNDLCANAFVITGATGTVATTTVDATNDGGACVTTTPDVWYSWTAPGSGNVTFSFCAAQGGSTASDSTLSMHTACGTAAAVCNDDFCGLASSISFAATSGTTYLVRVASFSGTTVGTMGWVFTNNDLCANARAITGVAGTVAATTVGYANDGGTAGCTGGSTPDAWFRWTAPANGNATFSFCAAQGGSSGSDTVLTMRTACGGADSVCNDDFCGLASSIAFAANSGTAYLIRVMGFSGTVSGTLGWALATGPCLSPPAGGFAEAEPCGSDTNGGCNSAGFTPIGVGQTVLGNAWADANFRDTDWYQLTLASSGTITWHGAGQMPFRLFILNGTCPAVVNQTAGGPACTEISCSALLCAGTYNLFAGPDVFTGIPCGSGTNDYWAQVTFVASPCPTPPPNDNCAAAISVGEGVFPWDNTNATTDGPSPCGAIGSDVWFLYSPSATGLVTATTCSGALTLDTVMAAYAAPCPAGTALACNDDGPPFCPVPGSGFSGSTLSFLATAGNQYLIQVGGFASGHGSGELTISLQAGPCLNPPAGGFAEGEPCGSDTNGGCNSAGFTPISVGQTVLGNAWADANTRDTDWYQITLAVPGTLTWTGAGQMPFRLFILNGTCPAVINVTAGGTPCTEISCSALLCAGTYNLFAGPDVFTGVPCGSGSNDYWAQVTFVAGDCPAAPPNNDCASAVPVSEGVTPWDNTGATQDGPAPCAPLGSDVWFLYTPSTSGPKLATTCSAALTLDTVIAAYDAPCPAGTALACNDDGPPFCPVPGSPFSGSTVTFSATVGFQYLIQISGYAGGFGSGELTISDVVPCAFTPDPDATLEGEECGSDINGGCNSIPPIYTDVTCNGTWTGSAWADGGTRDTDWYRFTLTETTTVTATLDSAFNAVLYIVNGIDTCTPGVPGIGGATCGSPGTVSLSLDPGTYVIFVATAGFTGLPCGADNGYNVTIDIGNPCVPPCPCDFNGIDGVNSQDFFDFLNCFFTPGCPAADFNNDGITNSQDFFDFLNCFFNPPAGC